jgi:hypothetical protein
MKPRAIFLLKKAPVLVSIPSITHFEQKCIYTSAILENVFPKVANAYSLVKHPTVVNRIPRH